MSTWGALSLGCLIGLAVGAITVLLVLSSTAITEDSLYQEKIVQTPKVESQEKSLFPEAHSVKREEPIQPSEPLVVDDMSQSSGEDVRIYSIQLGDTLWPDLHCLLSRPRKEGIRLLSLPPQRIVIDERLTESKKNTLRTICYESVEISILR